MSAALTAAARRDVLKWAGLAGLAAVGARWVELVPALEARPAASPLLTRVCQIVIPATETGGAMEAGVPVFLPVAFDHGLFGGDPQTIERLAAVLGKRVAGGNFLAASHEAQLQALTALDNDTFAHPKKAVSQTTSAANAAAASGPAEYQLWRVVKDAIVSSYYHSEIGGEKELTFQLIAGEDYRADVDVFQVKYMSNFWIENAF